MKDEVPGMRVPDELVERMGKAEDPKEEGVTICAEIMRQVRDIEGVAGVHIMPVMWESITPTLVERAGFLPRPTLPPLPEPEIVTEEKSSSAQPAT
jgi:methylenetetrahydrofolate reductase (NADPH)